MIADSPETAVEALRPYIERARGFSGWSSFPKTRDIGPPPAWDYLARARELLSSASSVLDIGTGGGERFGAMLDGFTGRAVATEEWLVNAPIASRHLRQFGAAVTFSADEQLPFADATFDLVLDRHSALTPADVARVLRPGGAVLTQQVTHDDWRELAHFFPRRTSRADHFWTYWRGFRDAGLTTVKASRHYWPVAYESLGDFVYMLCIAPWEVPDFDPLDADLESLLALERALTTPNGLVITRGSYIIEARKDG